MTIFSKDDMKSGSYISKNIRAFATKIGLTAKCNTNINTQNNIKIHIECYVSNSNNTIIETDGELELAIFGSTLFNNLKQFCDEYYVTLTNKLTGYGNSFMIDSDTKFSDLNDMFILEKASKVCTKMSYRTGFTKTNNKCFYLIEMVNKSKKESSFVSYTMNGIFGSNDIENDVHDFCINFTTKKKRLYLTNILKKINKCYIEIPSKARLADMDFNVFYNLNSVRSNFIKVPSEKKIDDFMKNFLFGVFPKNNNGQYMKSYHIGNYLHNFILPNYIQNSGFFNEECGTHFIGRFGNMRVNSKLLNDSSITIDENTLENVIKNSIHVTDKIFSTKIGNHTYGDILDNIFEISNISSKIATAEKFRDTILNIYQIAIEPVKRLYDYENASIEAS